MGDLGRKAYNKSEQTKFIIVTADLEFLGNFWKKAKDIGYKIKVELPVLKKVDTYNTTSKLQFINYSEIHTWSIENNLDKINGISTTLTILADKINYMIINGRANDVQIMIEKICSGRIKSLTKKPSKRNVGDKNICEAYCNLFLGRGHFRWNYRAHTLNKAELERLREYFDVR